MQQECIRIAIMDDHRVFSEALSRRLSAEPDLEVVGTAGSLAEAVDLFLRHKIDVVTLELELGGKDGLAVGRRLAARSPDLAIVVVTAAAEHRVREAVELGVRGWVPKHAGMGTLLAALRGAASGNTVLPTALLTRAIVSLSEQQKTPTVMAAVIARLSARELEVLRCLMDGLSRNEIATLLNISRNTVAVHIQGIMHKFKVHSAVTAVAFARRAGVVSNREYAVIPPKYVVPAPGPERA